MQVPEILVVMTTFPSRQAAESVAAQIITEQLAACFQVGADITSFYPWEGKLERGAEVVCWLKTSKEGYRALESRLAELHPYEVPEIIAWQPERVYRAYAQWVGESVK